MPAVTLLSHNLMLECSRVKWLSFSPTASGKSKIRWLGELITSWGLIPGVCVLMCWVRFLDLSIILTIQNIKITRAPSENVMFSLSLRSPAWLPPSFRNKRREKGKETHPTAPLTGLLLTRMCFYAFLWLQPTLWNVNENSRDLLAFPLPGTWTQRATSQDYCNLTIRCCNSWISVSTWLGSGTPRELVKNISGYVWGSLGQRLVFEWADWVKKIVLMMQVVTPQRLRAWIEQKVEEGLICPLAWVETFIFFCLGHRHSWFSRLQTWTESHHDFSRVSISTRQMWDFSGSIIVWANSS